MAPRLQPLPTGRSDEPLTIAVDRMAREGGLADTLAAVEPAANGALRARFTGAKFDALVLLLARLQKVVGGLQVLLCGLALGGLAMVAGLTWQAALRGRPGPGAVVDRGRACSCCPSARR